MVGSLLRKIGGSHQIEDVKQKESTWCHRIWVQEIMVLKYELFKSILIHVQGLNYGESIYELEDHVGEETLNSNLPFKLGPINWIILIGFPNHLLENDWVIFTFPYALSPFHEGVKQDTIGVTRGVNEKQPHHKNLMLVYQMENKMPLVHHAGEWYGCNCIIENDKSQDGRTQGHLMSKLEPMQVNWE